MGSRLLCLLCFPLLLAGATVPISAALPAGVSASNVAVDGAGAVYLAGTLQGNAFVAKLNADATGVQYLTTFPGTRTDFVLGLAVTPDGRAFVAGYTNSASFPATANWAGAAYPPTTNPYGFVAALNADGSVKYSGPMGPLPESVAANVAGEAYLSGWAGQIAATPGALDLSPPAATPVDFVMKLDSTGTHVVFVAAGLGGNLALDAQGYLYIAGATTFQSFPTTPGAYQTSFQFAALCGTYQLSLPCPHQYIAKVAPDGAALVYSTFVTGHGEANGGITVDSSGNVFVTGSTIGGYPVTPGALQTTFPSRLEPSFLFDWYPVGAYASKLNADGTALLFSTYLGGSGQDAARGVGLDAAGDVIVSGTTSSPDFPGIAGTPARCLPQDMPVDYSKSFILPYPWIAEQGFVAQLKPDGSAVTAAHLFAGGVVSATSLALTGNRAWITGESGTNSGVIYSPEDSPPTSTPAGQILALPGTAATPGATFVTAMDLAAPAPAASLACVLDAADYTFLGPVAPGQLITLFGSGLGPAAGVAVQPVGGTLPNSLAGVTVAFDGMPAPLLYASDSQVNVVAPYELAGKTSTTMQISANGVSVAQRVMAVAARVPTALTYAAEPAYGGDTAPVALVLNADGTQNSSTNPAAVGSDVTVFLNGVGVTGTQLPDGAVNPATPPPLTLRVEFSGSGVTLDSAAGAPNQVSGVWQIRLKVTGAAGVPKGISDLTVGGVQVRNQVPTIW